jgi:LPS-assembly protein
MSLVKSFARKRTMLGCALAVLMVAAPASAQQIVPANFFSLVPASAGDDMAVSADTMVFRQSDDTVTAQGNVGINFEGYRVTADRAIYYQRTGRVELVGNVAIIDPDGIEYVADRVELENDFRDGFLQALTVAFPDGTFFTAAETSFSDGVERVYEEGVYAPCGTCIDSEGRRIGWTVSAVRIITDDDEQTIYFDQPSLELLGFPVLWLPFLTLPRDRDIELPLFDYDERFGYAFSFPFFSYDLFEGQLDVTPTVYTRQGVGLGLDWSRRIGDLDVNVSASGIYQLDPDAYDGLGNTRFRGAIQSTGRFTPTDEWTLGWSYTAFTDASYLPDYRIATGTARNQVYATHLNRETFADIRLQQFLPMEKSSASGSYSSQDAYQALLDRQPTTRPNARGDHIVDLDDDMGRVRLEGRLLGLTRNADDQSGLFNGERYARGYAGNKVHGMAQASWTNQWIVPGGLAVSPYLGLRADGAGYEGDSDRLDAPDDQVLFAATPIAALDIRYPLIARTTGAAHVIEPVAQLAYRASDTSIVGITNEDSQGLLLNPANIFSFSRFSGGDRQETGLRANVGANLQTSFDNGNWIHAVAGQSFHLAGTNAFEVRDGSVAGIGTGLEGDASYMVAGINAGFSPFLTVGGQVQYDPEAGEIMRGLVNATGTYENVTLTAGYAYVAQNTDLGSARDRNEIAAEAQLRFAGYWTAKAGVAWDLEASEWLQTTAGLVYDDRFLAFGIEGRATGPTHRTADDLRVMAQVMLRAAGGREVIGIQQRWDGDEFGF